VSREDIDLFKCVPHNYVCSVFCALNTMINDINNVIIIVYKL